jgi:non-canonical (house-cleaning) NTP pyrophosphatase
VGCIKVQFKLEIIAIASFNPVKIQAVKVGFQRMFPGQNFELEMVSVPSGVSEQPYSDAETLQGGVDELDDQLCAFAWVVILSNQLIGKSRTGTFFLPHAVAELVRKGKELGEADDIIFNRRNSKQENGAVGILTDNAIDRSNFYIEAVILALIPFKNPELYL